MLSILIPVDDEAASVKQHPHIFDIQPRFLVEAIGMFNLRTIAPGGKDRFGLVRVEEGTIGQ